MNGWSPCCQPHTAPPHPSAGITEASRHSLLMRPRRRSPCEGAGTWHHASGSSVGGSHSEPPSWQGSRKGLQRRWGHGSWGGGLQQTRCPSDALAWVHSGPRPLQHPPPEGRKVPTLLGRPSPVTPGAGRWITGLEAPLTGVLWPRRPGVCPVFPRHNAGTRYHTQQEPHPSSGHHLRLEPTPWEGGDSLGPGPLVSQEAEQEQGTVLRKI